MRLNSKSQGPEFFIAHFLVNVHKKLQTVLELNDLVIRYGHRKQCILNICILSSIQANLSGSGNFEYKMYFFLRVSIPYKINRKDFQNNVCEILGYRVVARASTLLSRFMSGQGLQRAEHKGYQLL